MNTHNMYVRKRNGELQEVSFDKILNRIKKLGEFVGEEQLNINYTDLAIKVIDQLYDEIQTTEIDELTAEQCASLTTQHIDYGTLATRVLISNHHKNTSSIFSVVMDELYNFKDVHGRHHPMISDTLYKITQENKEYLNSLICHHRDYDFDYFGFKTLERAYLMKINGKIVERPQYMWLRVALCIHENDMEKVSETYELMSKKYFTHATPTLFNAGTPRPQMSSCYLLAMEDDSIKGIYNTLSDCASISKWAGGIGLHIHNIRGTGSHIRGTNGTSNGIVPMLRVFNNTARYCDQGGGKRNGSFAMYLEPWHSDIEEFLELKKNHGDEEMKARDLFYALWIPDLFMKRVKENGKWTLMCPDKCPGLCDVYGEKFEELYTKYEEKNLGNKTIDARQLWMQILDSQIETGTPYLLYKDACNIKSNQKNRGTIKSSNLCTEIIEYSDKHETAVCNLASIGLSKFVKPFTLNNSETRENKIVVFGKKDCVYCKMTKYHLKQNKVDYIYCDINDANTPELFKTLVNEKYDTDEEFNMEGKTMPQIYINGSCIGGYSELVKIVKAKFDYEELHKVTKVVTRNLNKVIDLNFYPTEKTRLSNLRNRPIGIGVQGLADVFCMMNLPFESERSREINKRIFETIYHASVETSIELSKERQSDMQFIKKLYDTELFAFQNDSDKTCRKYILKDILGVNKENNYQTPIDKTLYRVLPTKDELTKLEYNHMGSYSTFNGSPASEGKLQFDLWNTMPSNMYDWNTIKNDLKQYGMRNSLLVAPMPTASTSQILGNNECFEPFTSNIYLRRTIAGEFVVINKYLLSELISIGLWNNTIKNKIIVNKGSIQSMNEIPACIREKYKIVWEISMKNVIDMAAERGPFICQSQSMNLWMENPQYDKLTPMHFYAWSKGLKTGMYYLRTKAKASAQQFTIEPEKINTHSISNTNDEEGCLMCSG